MSAEKVYDLAIIGGGPTGLTAAIYAARAELSTVVLEKGLPGGQVQNTMAVDNYPGFPEVTGAELAERFHEHARKFGAEIQLSAVDAITYDGKVHITTDTGQIVARAALLATGAHWRHMDVPGEEQYIGRGVSSCAVCDGFFYRGKDVVVVGGGDAACEEGVYLTHFARSVTVIHRRDKLRAQMILQKRALQHSHITFLWNTIVQAVEGDEQRVTGVRLHNLKEQSDCLYPTDGVFVYIGMQPNTSFLQGVIELDKEGFVRADKSFRTSMPGVYAAGDVRSGAWRQIITVAAEGALAIREIERFLLEEKD